MEEFANSVLPPEVQRALREAAQAPVGMRHVEIDRVIDWARFKYPEFFREEADRASTGCGQ